MKDGGWIPVDKRLVSLLPKDREYTFLEAYISYRTDIENGCENSLNSYARMWSWSRNKVRHFVEGLRTGKGHVVDNQRTGKGQEIRLVFNNLEEPKDNQGTTKGQAKDNQGTITINPNPNPNPKSKRFVPPTENEVAAYMHEIGFNGNSEKFVSHYESNGWKVGKNKMKDWKAAVRTWRGNNFSQSPPQPILSQQKPEYGTPEYQEWTRKQLAY